MRYRGEKKAKMVGVIGLLILVGFAALGVVWLLLENARQTSESYSRFPEEADLAEVWQEARPFEALTSMTREHVSFRNEGSHFSKPWAAMRDRAVRRRLGDYPTAKQLHQRALWLMLRPERKGAITKAINDLELALQKSPTNGAIALDLSAAYFYQAQRSPGSQTLSQAIQTVQQSLALEPTCFKGRFNLALILGSFHLKAQAGDALRDCLQLTKDPAWQNEITQHLQKLAQPSHREQWQKRLVMVKQRHEAGRSIDDLLEGFWSDVSRHLELELLPAFYCRAGVDPLAIDLADVLATRDPFWSEVLTALLNAEPEEIQKQMLGFALVKRALQKRAENNKVATQNLLKQAMELLGNNPYKIRLRYFLAEDMRNKNEDSKFVKVLNTLAEEAAAKGYINLQGQTLWLRYQVAFQTRAKKELLQELNQIERLFSIAKDRDNLAGVSFMRAELYLKYGDYLSTWRALENGLGLLPEVSYPKRHGQMYSIVSHYFQRVGHLGLSLRFAQESLVAAERFGERWMIAAAHGALGEIYQAFAEMERAGFHRQQAEKYKDAIKDPSVLVLLEADGLFSEALSLPASQAKLAKLQDAFAMMCSINNFSLEAQMLEAVAETYLGLGELEKAKHQYLAVIQLFEADLKKATANNRRSLLLRMDKHYRILAELAMNLNQEAEAFFYLEAKRTKFVEGLEHAANTKEKTWRPLKPEQIQARLHDDESLLVFQQESSALYVWVLQRNHFKRYYLIEDLSGLEIMLSRFISDLKNGVVRDYLAMDARLLFEMLMGPVFGFLGDGPLGFVLDSPLYGLPLAALMDHVGAFQVETKALTEAPSASAFVYARTHQLPQGELTYPQIHIIGATQFDAFEHKDLAPLKGAEREVTAVSGVWKVPSKLGVNATKTVALQAFAAGGLVHLAAHAVADGVEIRNSKFIFAKGKGEIDTGELRLKELESAEMSKIRLLVLSACSTARGTFDDGNSVTSFTQALIAKGVPNIIASYWDIEDEATQVLMIALHRQLHRGAPPAQALASAQRQLISEGCQSSTWAGFGVFGNGSQPRH